MSKLDEIFEQYTNLLRGYAGDKITNTEAKQEIRDLFLELIGEDEHVMGVAALMDESSGKKEVIQAHRSQATNELRAELRKKVEEL